MREDWVDVELEEVCEICDNLRKPINSKERNKRIKGKKNSELYPYYGATGQVGLIDDYLTNGKYVLIGEDGAPFYDFTKNIAYLIKGKTWVNNHAHILLSNFNNKFLLHYLNQFNFHGFVSGTTRLKLTQGSLKKIPVVIAPLPEQRAIVAKIEQLFSKLDNGIANLKTAKDKLEIYRQAVLKKAFEGELTKEWREKQTDLPSADELLKHIKDAIERGVRTRTLNPKWLEAMLEHGYDGAVNIEDRVENILGLAATTEKVANWVWDEVTDRIILNKDIRMKIEGTNPWAFNDIIKHLIEAEKRGYWEVSQESLEELRDTYLEVEGSIEERGEERPKSLKDTLKEKYSQQAKIQV